MKDILDYEEPPKITRKPSPLAYLLEGIPILLIVFFLLNNCYTIRDFFNPLF